MSDVVMPRLSDSMEEGTILKWLKQDGDTVSRGDELVEIETDKANMTYEADQDGVLEIVAEEGRTLSIGEVIARIGEGAGNGGPRAAAQESDEDEAPRAEEAAGEDEPDARTDAPDEKGAEAEAPAEDAGEQDAKSENEDQPASAPPDTTGNGRPAEAEDTGATASAAPAAEDDGGERVKASPVARRVAQSRGVDLRGLHGTGPGGRIVKADVEAAAGGGEGAGDEATATAPPTAARTEAAPAEAGTAKGDVQRLELSKTQQVIARRMAESRATVPDFTLQAEIDMEAAVEAREQLKALAGEVPAPSYNDMVVKACALALREFPRVNGAYRDGSFELYSRVNIGVAVAAREALVVPTIFDADRKTLGEIARDSRALAEKVRDASISPPELSGGTFTISNLGMYGITNFSAVINPPQAAILAVGALEPRAVVRDGEVVARHVMAVTLACDHRILYGADAAEFLARVRALLETPAALAL